MSEHQHRGPWAVWLNTEDLDRNGQPYKLSVRLADERHVTEETAQWLRGLLAGRTMVHDEIAEIAFNVIVAAHSEGIADPLRLAHAIAVALKLAEEAS